MTPVEWFVLLLGGVALGSSWLLGKWRKDERAGR